MDCEDGRHDSTSSHCPDMKPQLHMNTDIVHIWSQKLCLNQGLHPSEAASLRGCILQRLQHPSGAASFRGCIGCFLQRLHVKAASFRRLPPSKSASFLACILQRLLPSEAASFRGCIGCILQGLHPSEAASFRGCILQRLHPSEAASFRSFRGCILQRLLPSEAASFRGCLLQVFWFLLFHQKLLKLLQRLFSEHQGDSTLTLFQVEVRVQCKLPPLPHRHVQTQTVDTQLEVHMVLLWLHLVT
ncbi:unnamed protein product [Pleuronectes platessa]|uniref:Uncharacterized protein n=1 Tax=Pleuronectes platessa TaxID=8262 RepID=A0A9N7TVY8_PLEPL|nr:unnamed protein product [Pleuronectes platessa]